MAFKVKKIENNAGFEKALEQVYSSLEELGIEGKVGEPTVAVIMKSTGEYTEDGVVILDVNLFVGATDSEITKELLETK